MTLPDDPRGLTLRSIATGMVIGTVLTPCNVYSGLKIGWSFNMSITSALIAFAFWRLAGDLLGARPWGMQENVMNQTTASSAASIISAGLVAPIPALTLLTGQTLAWPVLALWVFSVSMLGIVVAMVMRYQMLVRERLVFPSGVATAETVSEIHAPGREAADRVRMLASAAVLSGGLKLVDEFFAKLPRWPLPVPIPPSGATTSAADTMATSAAAAGSGATVAGARELGFVADPSLLMVGFGAIIGLRSGLSLLLGAVIAWLGLAPWILGQGWVEPIEAGKSWFSPLVEWLLWPGVMLMTVASLASLVQALLFRRQTTGPDAASPGRDGNPGDHLTHISSNANSRTASNMHGLVPLSVPVPVFVVVGSAVTALVVFSQAWIFGIPPWAGVVAVVLAFLLAVVAARVVGETGIPPIGAIGKVAQLSLAITSPGNSTMNLMGANVTGGAAGQCGDLLEDLRCGQLLGSAAHLQVIAQSLGVLTGSLVGSIAYLVLIPDPAAMLLTDQWPAPAVATWKAVAEVMAEGIGALPAASLPAMIIAAVAGLVLSVADHWLPPKLGRFVPSAPALGLAFVIPASISLAMCLGAILAAVAARVAPGWAARFVLAIAAGLVAGESLAGIAAAMMSFARG